jgi:hypothetical protein
MLSCRPHTAWIGTRHEVSLSRAAVTIRSRTAARMSETSGLSTRSVVSCGLRMNVEASARKLIAVVEPSNGVARQIAWRTPASRDACPRLSKSAKYERMTRPPWLWPTSVSGRPR